MTFGTEWGIGVEPEESMRVLDAYFERGGNFIDTANAYNKGHSEVILGDYFADGPGRGRRDRVVIATKFMGNLFPGDPNGGGGGRKAVLAACEESLRRLRTDYIDLYWAHFHDPHTPVEETMAALETLVQHGKVLHLGVSDHPAWICVQAQYEAKLRGWAPLIALQIEYSLLQRTVEGDLIPMAEAMGLGVTPWSPLRGGVLSGKFSRSRRPEAGSSRVAPDSRYLVESTWVLIDELEAIAKETDSTVARVALAWVQSRRGVTSTIIGARTVEQLLDNLRALELTLSPEQIARLDERSKPALPFPHEFLPMVQSAIHNGAAINGASPPDWHLSPKGDDDRW